ncbi:MAG: RluA family pseudouridine synthase [Phycisphaerae bacterium]|nr:RluA family pseudouridine synthase [Phycisphaerae bacterium]
MQEKIENIEVFDDNLDAEVIHLTNSDLNEQQEGALEEDGAQHERLIIRRLLPNRRIDKYVHHRFPDASRTMIQKLIKEKAITVNGLPTKKSYELDPGDKIDIILPPPPTNEIIGEDIPLDVIYEDEHIIVLNKQADFIVHPARGHKSGTMVNALVHYSNSLSSVSGDFRPGIVHRLDRNTTGVILIAKTDTAHWRIAHQFEHRLTQKVYTAIVHGNLELDADVIDEPLGRHSKVREKYSVVSKDNKDGRHSTTMYQVAERFDGYTLMKLFPKTGRTHQLRVHMSYLKHPIVADDMYGGKFMTLEQLANGKDLPVEGEPGYGLAPGDIVINRQALHASELMFKHPITGKDMHIIAPLKADMQMTLALLAKYRTIEKKTKKR